jgi:glycine cleavage system H protein
MDLTALRYAKSHEWAKLDGDVVTVGITAFAAEQLNDITVLDLKKVTQVKAGTAFGEVESVKSVSDLYAPGAGEIVERNAAAVADPSLISADPFGKGWMVKIKLAPGATLDHLLTKAQYDAQLAADGY